MLGEVIGVSMPKDTRVVRGCTVGVKGSGLEGTSGILYKHR